MKGLILKDFLNLRKYSRSVFLVLAFYVLYGVMLDNASFIVGMISLLFTMMAITSFSYDDLAKWDKYALSLPVTRKEMVLSKYILAVILAIAGALLAFASSIILSAIKTPVGITEQLAVTYVLFAISIIFVSILLPLIYKFGVEKSRIMILLVFAVPAAIVFVLGNVGFKLPTESQLMTLLYASPFIIIAVFAISYLISYSVYKKKDL